MSGPGRRSSSAEPAVRWTSAISQAPDLVQAVREAASAIRAEMGEGDPNLILVFVSEHHKEGFGKVSALVGSEFGSSLVFGCTARSVIGGGREVEHGPGLSLTAAILPGVSLHPFHFGMDSLPDGPEAREAWEKRFGPELEPHFLLLSDPFSFDVEPFMRDLAVAFPHSKAFGGLASSGTALGDNAFFIGSEVHRQGLSGLAFSGNVEIETLVAPGCRPIGTPLFVTRAQDNVLCELDGKPALDVLRELYSSLDQEDRNLARGSLFLGLEMRGDQPSYGQGDFLIRNLLGSDEATGGLVIGGVARDRQVVQFHLRDAESSSRDLEDRLSWLARLDPRGWDGALLFSCLGRGAALFGRQDHDSALFQQYLGPISLGGFFGNGEIGPVGGSTFLHGYTSAFALFRGRKAVGSEPR
jgi:small ligand-binding sensory domain FIST